MSSFLATACRQARERVDEARRLVSDDRLQERASRRVGPRSLAEALTATDGVAVIAEIKRASPSKGHLAWVPDPAAHAAAYAAGGAAALSVLTEPAHFHGTLADLEVVTAGVALPAIRKDFVVDAYQIWEARAAGAAAVLLIVAALDDDTLATLLTAAETAGLDALVEVHDAGESERASRALASADVARRPVVGVNARDLATLVVDPDRFAACVDALPAGAVAVAESGVATADDVRRAAAAGADAVLVGEHVVTAEDPTTAVRNLVTAMPAPDGRDAVEPGPHTPR